MMMKSLTLSCSVLLVGLSRAWDYSNNGTDWTDGICGDATKVQSPRDMQHTGTDWYKDLLLQFVFLPGFIVPDAQVTSAKVENFVYTVNATYGSLFAKEPANNDLTKIVKWDAFMLKFHYPAEHLVQGV